MKRFLLALLSSAFLAGLVAAQQSDSPGATSSAGTETGRTSSSGSGTGQAATPGSTQDSGPSCAPKVCVPEPAVTTIQKVHYCSRYEDFCLPKCPGLHHSHTDCQGCTQVDCPACGRVHHRKLLIKKIENIECPGFKCVPKEVGDCASPDGCLGGACSALPAPSQLPAPSTSAAPAPSVERLGSPTPGK